MFSAKFRVHLLAFSLLLVPLLLQVCLGTIQYRSSAEIRSGFHADILNFSDRDVSPDSVDDLYLEVARLMGITPNSSKPRPKVLLLSPAEIHQRYLSLRPSAKTQGGVAVALYIPHQNTILIPHFDRTLLSHELPTISPFTISPPLGPNGNRSQMRSRTRSRTTKG